MSSKERSDTSLMNFMQNHRVSVFYDGSVRRWVAKSLDSLKQGMGSSIRTALIDLERSMKHGR